MSNTPESIGAQNDFNGSAKAQETGMSDHKCPDCKGCGGSEYDPNPEWLTDMEYAEPKQWRECLTCKGKGQLSPLAYACRIAGGPPVVQGRGFA